MDEAYENDDIRREAESAMLLEALQHWDDRVRRILRRARPASGQHRHLEIDLVRSQPRPSASLKSGL
jgi:hypothetical protein